MSIKQLDEFIERQGIKSAELCKIMNSIKNQIKEIRIKNRELMTLVENLSLSQHHLQGCKYDTRVRDEFYLDDCGCTDHSYYDF